MFYPNYEYDALRVVTACGEDRFSQHGESRARRRAGRPSTAETRAKDGRRRMTTSSGCRQLAVGDERLCKRRAGDARPDQAAEGIQRREHPAGHGARRAADLQDEELREQMKDCALGTPATRAAIIERLIDVGYVRRSGKRPRGDGKGRAPDMKRCRRRSLRRRRRAAGNGRWRKSPGAATAKRASVRALRGWRRFLVENAAGAPDVAFAKEERRGKKRVPTLGVACPVCGQGARRRKTARAFTARASARAADSPSGRMR